jgi:hypothetical protein
VRSTEIAGSTQLVNHMLELYPLGTSWERPSVFTETVVIGTTPINLCGLATGGSDPVTGSAADLEIDPVERAYFELIERTSIIEAITDPVRMLRVLDRDGNAVGTLRSAEVFPRVSEEQFAYARSNGVAAGYDWGPACDAARWELLERDRVLRSWFGEVAPCPTEISIASPLAGLAQEYAFSAYVFPGTQSQSDAVVVGVFAFPLRPSNPLAYGFGCHPQRERALEKATRECVQRLGFLWGEALPQTEPHFATNAEYHQDFYLQPSMQSRLQAWLSGAHALEQCKIRGPAPHPLARGYVDLTPDHLKQRLLVVKALPGVELALTFGRGHPAVEPPVPEQFQVHPLA